VHRQQQQHMGNIRSTAATLATTAATAATTAAATTTDRRQTNKVLSKLHQLCKHAHTHPLTHT